MLAVVLAGAGVAGCQEVVDLTRRPIERAAEDRMFFAETPIYVSSPIQLDALSGQIESALPERIIKINQRIRDIACKDENGRRRCGRARVQGQVVRAGAATIVGDGQALAVEIPLSYAFEAQGERSYSDLTDSVSGKMSMRYLFDLAVDEDWQVQVRGEGLRVDGSQSIKILDGELRIVDDIERIIASRVRRLRSEIERSLAAPEIRANAEAAWRNLHSPVALGKDPAIWLRGEPSEIRFGGISNKAGQAELKFAVMTRMRTAIGERPMPLIAQPLPKLGQEPLLDTRSSLVLPIEVPYERIVEQVRKVLPLDSELDGEASGDVKISVRELAAFPSEARLVITASLAVDVGDEWKSLYGAAHFLTTPVVADGTAELRLTNVEAAERTQSPSLYRAGAFIVPLDPLSKTLAGSVSIDLTQEFDAARAQLSDNVDVQLGKGMRLVGEFDQVRVRSLEPLRHALRLNLEIFGDLTVRKSAASATAESQLPEQNPGAVQ